MNSNEIPLDFSDLLTVFRIVFILNVIFVQCLKRGTEFPVASGPLKSFRFSSKLGTTVHSFITLGKFSEKLTLLTP